MPGTPPFFPSIGTLPLLDYAIQFGRGVAAGVIGQSYDVRRLTEPVGATGAISSQVPIYTNYPCRLRRTTSKMVIENDIFSLICYEGTCDNTVLEIGDQLTETGYEAMEAGVYIFAQARPTRESLFMRAESNISITRMKPGAGLAADQPVSGWTADDGLGSVQKSTEQVLTLTNGSYSFQAEGASPASLQVGLQPIKDIKDTPRSAAAGTWPVALYREKFLCYIPLFPGESLNELDRLNFPNEDRYEIATLYTSETSFLSGWIAIVEKLGV
jgi:hypothetical protein